MTEDRKPALEQPQNSPSWSSLPPTTTKYLLSRFAPPLAPPASDGRPHRTLLPAAHLPVALWCASKIDPKHPFRSPVARRTHATPPAAAAYAVEFGTWDLPRSFALRFPPAATTPDAPAEIPACDRTRTRLIRSLPRYHALTDMDTPTHTSFPSDGKDSAAPGHRSIPFHRLETCRKC